MTGMSRLLALLATVALLASCPLASAEAHARQRVPLESGWTFRQLPDDGLAASWDPHPPEGTGEWLPAVVPGDVHLDLLRNKRIADPFFRDNESKLQWIERAGWEYRTSIDASAAVLAREHIDLVFEGLDTACTLYLNGERIAAPNNMFREWRIDVKTRLHQGQNELRIVFPAPMKAAEAVAEKDPWHARTHTDPKGYIRKAVYEFGWDWGPRFATSGVYRPAYLELWDDARINGIFVEQEDVKEAAAHLDVHADVLAGKETKAVVSLSYGIDGAETKIERAVTLATGENHISFPVEIVHPRRWWPAGYGEQPLYKFHVAVNAAGHELDARDTKTGLRSVVLRRDLDMWGRSFEFVINGVPVFAKGADVIPFDSFPSRVTEANYRRILGSAKEANMNIVRLWGGGYYETDQFYEICDELGLMVWNDLMFGNNWQPGTYEFKQDIEQEAEYQMTRLRNHPSIVLWAGNNETELLRDWNGNGQLPPAVHERIWEDYLTEFSGILARTAARITPQIPYWPSSPSADYEELSDSYQSGDNHDWTVWHGQLDFSAYNEHHWRFISEFGFQSFPEMKTVESFTTPEDRANIFTPVMKAHQKNGNGNKLIDEYMNRYFGEPKDFASFLYASQVLQAEAIKTGAEGWRRARPRTMGTIFWQLNDCWPVASWSSIDYDGRWKALQYYARRFYAPVLVSPQFENGTLSVYIVSDKMAAENGSLRLRIMDFSGKVVKELTQNVTVSPLASQVYMQLPMTELLARGQMDMTRIVGVADLTVSEHTVSTNLAYFVPSKQIALAPAAVTARITKAGDGYDVTLQSASLARSTYVSFGDLEAQFSDNYIDLLPNEPVTIHAISKASLEQLRTQMKVVSLGDAFVATSK